MSNGLSDHGQSRGGAYEAGAEDFKEQVRVRSDIAQVIGESISLKALRGGAELAGLCPFHDDRNPSLKVYPDRQTFRCWSCDTGGDVFSFVMKYDGLDFFSALKHLAQRAGLEMPERTGPRPSKDGPDRGRLLEVLKWADLQCHTFLTRSSEAKAAREYLAARGIHADLAKTYGLGYHPDDWSWLVNRAKGLFDREELLASGVAGVKKDGSGLRDHALFPDRVIFPIRDERGRTIAFGGRQLPSDSPRFSQDKGFGAKYINSSESVLFHKSKVLYGLDVAREAIRKPTCDTALVVEGYTDTLALHHASYQNVVATLGTALTKEHVGVLRRFTNRIVLVLDGDRAGQDAAEKALQKLLAESVDLRVLTLPPGTDPADFVSEQPEAFGELVATAPEALDFKLSRLTARHGGDALQAGDAATKEMLDLLRTDPGLVGTRRGDLVLMRTSERFGVPERRLRADLNGHRPAPRQFEPPAQFSSDEGPVRREEPPIPKPAGDELAEAELLKILLTRPELFPAAHAVVGSADLRHAGLRRLFELCEDAEELDGAVTLPAVLDGAAPQGDSPLKRFAVKLMAEADSQELGGRLDGSIAGGFAENGTRRAAFSADGLAAGAATTAPGQTRHGNGSQEGNPDHRSAGVPPLLSLALSAITRRRRSHQARSSRADLAHAPVSPGGLDEATRALLRRQADLHAARHARPG
ncbi:DNA primase [Alienimonas chondri]|uniref:DNA primase n=1 Tax=Alienimonas chondri TaxID=2681879 RepID=A0ABX1VBR5_9PLAN|nr:DNA primase [Alienimonas chondri]NNJ24737.1 DNA primase [Alienimonas chondri]